MNPETTILVAIVLAVMVVASVFVVAEGGLNQAGKSLMGEGDGISGIFTPSKGEDGNYQVPNPENQLQGQDGGENGEG